MIGKHYCLRCGTVLSVIPFEGRMREVCLACGWVNYAQLKVSAGALLEENGKLLLIRRATEPWSGCWCMPAGYVEVDEDPARAAERETFEETGFEVKAGRLINYYPYSDDPRGNGLVLIFNVEKVGGSPKLSSETLDVNFFSPDEISNLRLAGETAQQSVQHWLEIKTSRESSN